MSRSFTGPTWWAWLRLVVGVVCALGFGIKGFERVGPGWSAGVVWIAVIVVSFGLEGLWGLRDLLMPRRVEASEEGLSVSRRRGAPPIPWEELSVRVEYVHEGHAAAGRFERLSLGAAGAEWVLRPWDVRDRAGLVSALRSHRGQMAGWEELSLAA
jgi:hypothetical protein